MINNPAQGLVVGHSDTVLTQAEEKHFVRQTQLDRLEQQTRMPSREELERQKAAIADKWARDISDTAKVRLNVEKLVQHPTHYTTGKIEVWDFITDQKLNFLEGNVVKYVARYKHKNGLQDLLKARQYLERLIVEAGGKAATSF